MNFAKKYTSGLALFFFLIILPIGSYFYLLTGLNFYKENKAEYAIKGSIPEFSATTTSSNQPLTNKDLMGHTFILSFFDGKAKESEQLAEIMGLVQDQFKNREDIKHITFLSDSLNTANQQLIEKAQPIKNKWLFLNGNEQTSAMMKSKFKFNEVTDHYSPEFVLVDDSLNVRGYYKVAEELQRNKLIVHLSMVMPRKKKEEVVFRREKEK